MDTIEVDQLCNDVAKAVEQLRIGFRANLDTPEVLDRFWCLQDQLARLIESASDRREETLDVLKRTHPGLVRDILNVLSFTEKLHFDNTSAGRTASLAINRSLAKLQYIVEQGRNMAAGA
ncbi:MAG: hypothetical protein ACR2JB_00195 [Bryobacteraceae bacterium]